MAVLHPSPPFDDLTYYPISRWIRGTRGKDTIVDTRRAVLVWEPGKKVPIYAFPREAAPPGQANSGARRTLSRPDSSRRGKGAASSGFRARHPHPDLRPHPESWHYAPATNPALI